VQTQRVFFANNGLAARSVDAGLAANDCRQRCVFATSNLSVRFAAAQNVLQLMAFLVATRPQSARASLPA
jgi:hypothetical protein